MSDLRGDLVVTVTYRIPVSERMYPQVTEARGRVSPEDIVAVEEGNYLVNEAEFSSMFHEHITEVDIRFEEGRKSA